MCVEQVTEIEVLEEDILAYKITNWAGFSRYSPGLRDLQTGFDNPGANIFYTIGDTYVSRFEFSPGLYCFVHKEDALKDKFGNEHLLEVQIPKGTRIKRATGKFYCNDLPVEVLLAEELVVLREVCGLEEPS